MRKIPFLSLLRFFVIIWLSFPGWLFSAPPTLPHVSPIDLTVLYVNDMHGHMLPQIDKGVNEKKPIGGIAYLARMIEGERTRNPQGTLLLAAGDMFQGTPVSNVFRGKPVMAILNHLHVDAMAVGNHEFDWGAATLKELATSARFPFLAANITADDHPLPWLQPHVILKRKGLNIAVIGLTTPETPFTTKADNVKRLLFLDPEKILPGLIKQLKDQKADLIIVLSHLGLDTDQVLAGNVEGIDVIVGGHSHTAVYKPLIVGDTIIVQAKCYAQYLGVLKLRIDPISKKIVAYNQSNLLKMVSSGPGDPMDPKVDRLLHEYNDRIREEFSAIVGETRNDLSRNPQGESALGNLICDAMREAAGSEIAFQNSGGIRSNIPKGKITLEQIFMVLPFDNELITMDLTGGQIRRVLEQSVHQDSVNLQVSGISVKYDVAKPDQVRAVDILIGDKPLDPMKRYRVTTNDFLASGGDRFSIFRQGSNIVYGGNVRDAFIDYLRKHSSVDAQTEGRITFIKGDKASIP